MHNKYSILNPTSTIFLAVIALSSCATPKPTPEQLAWQNERHNLELNQTRTDCDLIDLLNTNRIQTKSKKILASDCDYFRKHASTAGYVARTTADYVPNFEINGFGLPIGSLVRLAKHAEDHKKDQTALDASLPSAISSRGKNAELVFRRTLRRGFNANEIAAVSTSGVFSQAMSATGAMTVFSTRNIKN